MLFFASKLIVGVHLFMDPIVEKRGSRENVGIAEGTLSDDKTDNTDKLSI